MTQDPLPDTPPVHDASLALPVFRRALRDSLILLAVLAVVGPVVGWLVSGSPGLWGAVVGVGLAAVFSLTTPLVMLRTVRSSLVTVTGVVMGTWLIKIVVVVAVLAAVRNADALDKQVLGFVLLAGVLGSLAADLKATSDVRIPYTQSHPGPSDGPKEGPAA
jgi:hypothetical protein